MKVYLLYLDTLDDYNQYVLQAIYAEKESAERERQERISEEHKRRPDLPREWWGERYFIEEEELL